MPRNLAAVVQSLLSSGMDMQEFGSVNWAFRRADALEAASRFYELGIPILGGDVWEMREGRPFLTHDNWFCERLADEPLLSFVGKSVELTKDYIRSYSSDENGKYLFELVIDGSEAMKCS
jgi:hypothetical protein